MMTQEQHSTFPVGFDFLQMQLEVGKQASIGSDHLFRTAGEKLPATVTGLGTVLSLLYRTACCAWGCSKGDHQIEWLVGRVVNQATGSYQLTRSACYDESLMLTRGIGEIANLLWLFKELPQELPLWENATRGDRLRLYGPPAVRKKLEAAGKFVPIAQDRYQRLCEVGTHPVPGVPPSHYTGSGRPVLSGLIQPVATYVCLTELAYAVGLCGGPAAALILQGPTRADLSQASVQLIRSLGAFHILSYDELLSKVLNGEEVEKDPTGTSFFSAL